MNITVNTAQPPVVRCVRSDCRCDLDPRIAHSLTLGERTFYLCPECWCRLPMEKIEQTCLSHPERGYLQ